MGPFTGLLHNKWILVLLVVLIATLIVESAILAIIALNWSLGNQNFPKFSFNPPITANCATLTAQPVSRNSDNRTVLFDCGTSTTRVAAFRVFAPLTLPYSPEGGKPDLAKPVFRLPPGYLNLTLTADLDYHLTCIPLGAGLVSGRSMYIGEENYAGVYDYCAVISNAVGQVQGFSIQWVEGTPPPPSPSYAMTASAYAFTIPAGATGSCKLTITSHHGFNGTIVFTNEVRPFVPGINVTGLPSITLQQSSIFLPPNGTVQISATIYTYSNTTTTTGYLAWFYARNGASVGGVLLDIRVT